MPGIKPSPSCTLGKPLELSYIPALISYILPQTKNKQINKFVYGKKQIKNKHSSIFYSQFYIHVKIAMCPLEHYLSFTKNIQDKEVVSSKI